MGVVYVVVNDLWPDLVKIGFSARSGHARAREFQRDAGTGCPGHFRCVYERRFMHPEAAEGVVHRAMQDRRAHKEWFRCSVAEARQAIDVVAADTPSIECRPKIERPPRTVQRIEIMRHVSTTSSGGSRLLAAARDLAGAAAWSVAALAAFQILR